MGSSHDSKITAISFSPDSKYIASGGIDCKIVVREVAKHMNKVAFNNAHKGFISRLLFLDNNTLASAGEDAAVNVWNVQV